MNHHYLYIHQNNLLMLQLDFQDVLLNFLLQEGLFKIYYFLQFIFFFNTHLLNFYNFFLHLTIANKTPLSTKYYLKSATF